MNILRTAWKTGCAQLALLVGAPWLALSGARCLLDFATQGAGSVTAYSAVDWVLSVYFVACMVVMVFVSASGAARMRTLLEYSPLRPGDWGHMAIVVASAAGAIVIIAGGGKLGATFAKIREHMSGEMTLTVSYGLTWTMLALWGLVLGYRFKLVWDALVSHIDEFEAVRWGYAVKPNSLKARTDRLRRKLECALATERARRGLEPQCYELKGLTEEDLIESAALAEAEMPPPKAPPTPSTASAASVPPPASRKKPAQPRKAAAAASAKSKHKP